MGTYNYYPKNSTSTQTFGIATYVPSTIKAMIVVGHGQGECGDGSDSALKNIAHWGDSWNGGWKDLKLAADQYGIVLVWVNTALTSKYSLGEIEFALNWGLAKFSANGIKETNSWYLGHSLGWYGAGRYFFNSLTRAKRVAGTLASASGPYGDTLGALTWQNLVDAGCKVWGVTATNDTVSGTDPKWVRYLYDKVKAISSAVHTIVSEFPTGTWSNNKTITIDGKSVTGSTSAHNAVLTKLTRVPIEVTPAITRGIVADLPIKMNIYEWILSNPRGSIYQDPTTFYTGAKYPNVEIKDFNIFPGAAASVQINWKDGSTPTTVKAATGDSIKNLYIRKNTSNQELITIAFAIATAKTYGPYK